MRLNKILSGWTLAQIFGAITLAFAAPLPKDWEFRASRISLQTTMGTTTIPRGVIINYPRAPGKTKEDYEVPRTEGIWPKSIRLLQHHNLHEVLPNLIENNISTHYLLESNGYLFAWIGEEYQTKMIKTLGDHTLTILVEASQDLMNTKSLD